jgi:WD40 repeat protein
MAGPWPNAARLKRHQRQPFRRGWKLIVSVDENKSARTLIRMGGDASRPTPAKSSSAAADQRTLDPFRAELSTFAALHATNFTDWHLSPDRERVATASADRTARIWKRHSLTPDCTLLHENTVNCVRFSPNGAVVVISTSDRKNPRLGRPQGMPVTDWISSDGPVAEVWIAPDNAHVVTSAGETWEFRFNDAPAPAWLAELAETIASVRDMDGRPDPIAFPTFAPTRAALAADSDTSWLTTWARNLLVNSRVNHDVTCRQFATGNPDAARDPTPRSADLQSAVSPRLSGCFEMRMRFG